MTNLDWLQRIDEDGIGIVMLNLKEMTARRDDSYGGFQYFQDLFATCSAMMQRIVNLPQPVIAEVKGT